MKTTLTAFAMALGMIAIAIGVTACESDVGMRPTPIAPGSWTLYVCAGVSSMGCGSGGRYVYPSKADCLEAQAAMRTGDEPIAESGLKRNTVTTCAPSRPGDDGYVG